MVDYNTQGVTWDQRPPPMKGAAPQFGARGGGPGLAGYRSIFGTAMGQSQNQMAEDRANQMQARSQELSAAYQSQDARRQQQALATQLANPSGPSVAEQQLRMGQDAGMAQALAMARSARGNPALAMRQAQMAQGQLSAQTAGQMALLRAQEEAQRRGELANLLGNMRGQDYGLMAGLQGSRGIDLNAQQLGQERELGYLAQQMGMEQSQLDAILGQRGINSQKKDWFEKYGVPIIGAGAALGASAV